MPRFDRGGHDDDRLREQEQSIESIRAGGLPLGAQRRLSAVAGARAAGGSSFTSDLSVPEFLMLKRQQLAPITQVMGSCIYHVGWQWTGNTWYGVPQELHTLTEAYNHAQRLALGRLGQEAELAAADGVVGVRVTAGNCEWGSDLIEFRTIGTAVSSPKLRTGDQAALTNLTGQEVAELLEAGYTPVGVVGATSVYYGCATVERAYQMQGFFSGARWQNFELTEFADAWWQARNHAMHRITQQANELSASGIVGVTWQQQAREHSFTYRGGYGGWQAGGSRELEIPGVIYTVHVLATAVAELEGAQSPPIYTMLSLNPRSGQ